MPLLDRDPARVRNREHLVWTQAHRPIARNAAQLTVDLGNRNAGPQCQRDQTAHRFGVGHCAAAGLAQRDEDLERLTLLVLGDVHEHHAEWGLLPYGGVAELVGAAALGAALGVLGL